MRKAVVNMALKLEKPILSLTNRDYNENGLADLLVEKGDAYEINLQVFYLLRDSITGWPGGKPGAEPAHASRTHRTLSQTLPDLLAAPRRRYHLHGRYVHAAP